MKMLKSTRHKLAAIGALILLAGMSEIANAGQATATFGVSATVTSTCTITATPMAFGAYNPLNASATTATSTVTIACTKAATSTIGMDNGLNFTGGFSNMKATDSIAYTVGQPPNNTPGTACTFPGTAWNTTTGLFTPAAAPSKAARIYNVCGSIAPNQDVTGSAGGVTYNDTVTASVNF
jgi:spore coat protein U-like protein